MHRLWNVVERPEICFLWLSLLFGVALCFVIPPFQTADEPNHFFRAYQVAQGNPFAKTLQGSSGGFIPTSVHTTTIDLLANIPHNPQHKQTVAHVVSMLDVALQPDEERFVDFRNTALYAPVPYVPQAIGIAIGDALQLSPLALFYIGRLCALLASVGLTFWAIKLVPIFKWFLVCFALLPMATVLRSSLSADNLTNSVALLLVALFLFHAFQPQPLCRRDLLVLGLTMFTLTLSKQAYLGLVLLFLLIPRSRFASTAAYVGAFTLVAGASVLGLAAWSLLNQPLYLPAEAFAGAGVVFDPHAQAMFIATNLFRFAMILLADAQTHGLVYTRQFVGILGWLDTYLPQPLYLFCPLLLLFVALVEQPQVQLNGTRRLLLVAIGVVNVLVVVTLGYLLWNNVASPEIWGIQGRYFIPIVPLFFLALANRRLQLRPAWVALVTYTSATTVLVLTLRALVERYYG